MADVTGRIASLPGSTHAVPAGMKCDDCGIADATMRVQGETDSMGSEMHDLCADCARKMREYVHKGTCESCKANEVELHPTRDFEEGLAGRVYYYCSPCIKRQRDALNAELDDWYDDSHLDYEYDDE